LRGSLHHRYSRAAISGASFAVAAVRPLQSTSDLVRIVAVQTTDKSTVDSQMIKQYQPGFGLPGGFYHDTDAYAAEMELIWRSGWLFAGHTCEVAEPGDYFTFVMDSDPIVVIRDDERQVRAFHNVCTHRGTMLFQQREGRVGRAVVCPYHQWTFTRHGD